MRNHRLFGVVIAVLLGTSFLHQRRVLLSFITISTSNQNNQQNQNSPVAGNRLGGAAHPSWRRRRRRRSPEWRPTPAIPAGEASRSDVLNPARAAVHGGGAGRWVDARTRPHDSPPRRRRRSSPCRQVAPTPKAAPAPSSRRPHPRWSPPRWRPPPRPRPAASGPACGSASRAGTTPTTPGTATTAPTNSVWRRGRAGLHRPALGRRARRAGPGRPGAPGPQRLGPVAGLLAPSSGSPERRTIT